MPNLTIKIGKLVIFRFPNLLIDWLWGKWEQWVEQLPEAEWNWIEQERR
jgi:hypothetical protein